jgi:hypothetical protein
MEHPFCLEETRKRIGSHVAAWSSSWPVLFLTNPHGKPVTKKHAAPSASQTRGASCTVHSKRQGRFRLPFSERAALREIPERCREKRNPRYVASSNCSPTVLVTQDVRLQQKKNKKKEWNGLAATSSFHCPPALQSKEVRCRGAACRLRLATPRRHGLRKP